MERIKSDTLLFGTVAGIIIPVLAFLLIYKIKEPQMALHSFIDAFYYLRVLPKLMSLCLVPNLILFFIFLRLNKLRSAKGVILSLFIFAIPIIILKFV